MTQSMKRIHNVTVKRLRDDLEPIVRTPGIAWENYGIRAEAEVTILFDNPSDEKSTSVIQTITSGGLFGLADDSGYDYLSEIEREQLDDLRDQLHAIGFSNRAITAAFRNVEREGN